VLELPSRMTKIPSNMIPQKENLDVIAEIPSLIRKGMRTPQQIANHFGQHVRHGCFLINACQILGWLDGDSLTDDGVRITGASKDERSSLIKEAVERTMIFRALVNEFGTELIENPNRDSIAGFLEECGLSKTTARRRASTLMNWAKYVAGQNDNAGGRTRPRSSHKARVVWSIRIEGNGFDAAILAPDGTPEIAVLNCIKYGLTHSLDKIAEIKRKDLKYLLLCSKDDYILFDLETRNQYVGLRDRIARCEIPGESRSELLKFAESCISDERRLYRIASRRGLVG